MTCIHNCETCVHSWEYVVQDIGYTDWSCDVFDDLPETGIEHDRDCPLWEPYEGSERQKHDDAQFDGYEEVTE